MNKNKRWNTRKEREMIEVGEYVRTPLQGIYIISHINLNFDDSDYKKVCLCQNAKVGFTSINETKKWKHSKNIIDLIEEGDYVNGEKIGQIENGFLWYGWSTEIDDYSTFFKEKDIETVVTKEQFAQMEYKVKD